MRQHKHTGHLRRWSIARPSVSVLLGAVALLAMLVVASWGSAHAAPQSGGEPEVTILSIQNNTLTLQFAHWTLNLPLTLSYSLNKTCSPSTSLPAPAFQITSDPFETTYTLPGGIKAGSYFLCVADSLDGANASANTFIVQSDGSVQPTPGTPGPTPSSASSPATRTPGAQGSPTATSTPGNQGVSATNQNNNSAGNTLVAIILLCLLVMALLAYLIRLWLQGRQTGGQPPAAP